MTKGCVSCHMSKDIADKDKRNVRLVGGHGLRMRDVGPDGDPGTKDDIFNNAVCRNCHADLDTFDRKGFQSRIKTKLVELGDLLKMKNHGFLPPFQAGKCATCHRGGTLPFINETADEVLNKAYKNYSLILHDRSFGIHNPRYIERLLEESIAVVKHTDSIYLSSYMAEPFRNKVNITWTTGYEKNICGFNLYRAPSEDGEYTKINNSLIPATGGSDGTSYLYGDKEVFKRKMYYYKIADTDKTGKETFHDIIRKAGPLLRYRNMTRNK